jgi:hypothetical protein
VSPPAWRAIPQGQLRSRTVFALGGGGSAKNGVRARIRERPSCHLCRSGCGRAKIQERLDEHDHVIQRRAKVTYLLPLVSRLYDQNPSKEVRVSSKVLRRTVHHAVGTPLEGVLQWWWPEGGVYDQLTTDGVDLVCVVLDVPNVSLY